MSNTTFAIKDYIVGESVENLTPPEIYHKIFSGWRESNGNVLPSTMPARNITVYGHYDENVSVITWLNKDGTVFLQETLYVGDEFQVQGQPNMGGYKFLGWDGYPKDGIVPSEDLTIRPKYRKYTIKCQLKDTGEFIYDEEFVGGTPWNVPEPYTLGKRFLGWKKIDNTSVWLDYDVFPEEDLRLYGYREDCNVYTARYYLNSFTPTVLATQKYNDGEQIKTPATPIHSGKYTVLRWDNVPLTITNDINIYGCYINEDYADIFYYGPYGDCIMGLKTVSPDSSKDWDGVSPQYWKQKLASLNSSVIEIPGYSSNGEKIKSMNVSKKDLDVSHGIYTDLYHIYTDNPYSDTLDLTHVFYSGNYYSSLLGTFEAPDGKTSSIKYVYMPKQSANFDIFTFENNTQLEKVYVSYPNEMSLVDFCDDEYRYYNGNPLTFAHYLYNRETGQKYTDIVLNNETVKGNAFSGLYADSLTLNGGVISKRDSFANVSIGTLNITKDVSIDTSIGKAFNWYSFYPFQQGHIGTVNANTSTPVSGLFSHYLSDDGSGYIRTIDKFVFTNTGCPPAGENYGPVKEMYIKSGTTSIPDNAQVTCKRIFLPSSVTYIGAEGLGSYRIKYSDKEQELEDMDLILKSTTPPTTGGNIVFSTNAADWWLEINKFITLYVPFGTLSAYKNSPYWKNQPIKEIKEGEPTD